MTNFSKLLSSPSPKFRYKLRRHLRPIKFVVLAVLVVIWIALFARNNIAATAQGRGNLFVRVGPAAAMSLTDMPAPDGTGLVRIDIAVRLNPGTTASLWQYTPPASSDTAVEPVAGEAKVIFTVSQNGRYSLTVGSGSNTRFELKSSDQSFDITKTF